MSPWLGRDRNPFTQLDRSDVLAIQDHGVLAHAVCTGAWIKRIELQALEAYSRSFHAPKS